MSHVADFLQKVQETYASGHAREHSYRPALKALFEGVTGLYLINEPKRSEYGAPDFVFLKDKTVVAYAEAKDINVSLSDIETSEQMARYYGYSNILLTNGLEFRFYRNAAKYGDPVVVGRLGPTGVEVYPDSYQLLEDTLRDFIHESKEPIKSGTVLAKVMAGKARRIRDNVKKFLADEHDAKNENLLSIYGVIKKLLLADLDHEKFADMYAQTLVYGLFVARYYDETPDDFSRQEARDLVPASNPFLRHFFDHIAGPSFDPRIEVIVRELCEEFVHADVSAIVHNYYKVGKENSRDPIIHFYEDFLQEYDTAERKKMGVFYTPLPVVRFIVRSVDDLLKKEFGLDRGLADASTVEMVQTVQGQKKKVSVHKVQVLDPATGTGTFINEAILHIKKSFEGQEGRWKQYVNGDLLPRLHGFELMMASYTIAHLKLSTTIKESGIEHFTTRLGVYLTNSLEKGEIQEDSLFAALGLGKAIAEESTQANRVKNDLPIMVVIGNPPYSGVSSNETEHANGLVEKYKVEPGGKQKLQERKHWLNDDYVKFIAFAEDLVAKNGEGVVGFITNHGYLDNPTFRGMRWHLLDTFDEIYVADLHGNAKKKEVAPGGGKDENVFAIQQGVAIMLAVKNGKKKKGELAKVYRADLWGKRLEKFAELDGLSLADAKWSPIEPRLPNLFFKLAGDSELELSYERGFSPNELFREKSLGFMTGRDSFATDVEISVLSKRIEMFYDKSLSADDIKRKFDIRDFRKFIIEEFKDTYSFDQKNLQTFLARPFDNRKVYYQHYLVQEWQNRVMRHLIEPGNVGLIIGRQSLAAGGPEWNVIFATKTMVDLNIFRRGGGVVFPLYVYADDGTKVPNLNKEIVKEIEKVVGEVTPEDILDYVYAVLHSPKYRETYKEFLKIDFPRVPYPKDEMTFKRLVVLGWQLRKLHLLESPKLTTPITTYPESGSDMVEPKYPKFEVAKETHDTESLSIGRVYINAKQYFGNVPEVAWQFYIGGYQPAQKWLKDRQGRTLTSEDLVHYQKIIVALAETNRIMGEIDVVV